MAESTRIKYAERVSFGGLRLSIVVDDSGLVDGIADLIFEDREAARAFFTAALMELKQDG